MISVSLFTCICKAGTFIITGTESLPCPICGGKLFVHGTCRRKLRMNGRSAELRLRILECSCCGKTHRELPHGIIPYKRYSAEMIYAICNESQPDESSDTDNYVETVIPTGQDELKQDNYICENSVRQRILKWMSWFIVYAESMIDTDPYKNVIDSPAQKLRYYVREVVNSGKWKQQHCSVISSA